jgi:uncharacterized protein
VRVLDDVLIVVRDGTRLSARIWLPEEASAGNPVPALLEYLPYRKSDTTAVRDAQRHPWYAAHGYASVRVDLRGSGDSEGVLLDEYTAVELADGVDVIGWLAAQPWCSGRVGMFGISWGGFNSLQIAALRPPALEAIVTVCSTDDRYADDVHYFGGAVLGIDMWRQGSVCEDYAAIEVPVLAVDGWADPYRNTVLRLLASLSGPVKGIIGPWARQYPDIDRPPGPRIGFLQETLRWWDRWLRDVPNGVESEPALRAGGRPPSIGHRALAAAHRDRRGAVLPLREPGGSATGPASRGRPFHHVQHRRTQGPGRVARASGGATAAARRAGMDRSVPALAADETVEVVMSAIAWVFPPGHRIRLSVSDAYWPWVWPRPYGAGPLVLEPAASELILPVRDPGAPSEPVHFEPPEQAPPLDVVDEAPPGGADPEREVRYFPQNEEWQLVVNPNYEGTSVFPDGLRKSENARETYSIRSGDPLSAVAASDWHITLSRPGWHTEIAAHGRMTADAQAFHTTHTVRATLDGAPVFEHSWQADIPRASA